MNTFGTPQSSLWPGTWAMAGNSPELEAATLQYLEKATHPHTRASIVMIRDGALHLVSPGHPDVADELAALNAAVAAAEVPRPTRAKSPAKPERETAKKKESKRPGSKPKPVILTKRAEEGTIVSESGNTGE